MRRTRAIPFLRRGGAPNRRTLMTRASMTDRDGFVATPVAGIRSRLAPVRGSVPGGSRHHRGYRCPCGVQERPTSHERERRSLRRESPLVGHPLLPSITMVPLRIRVWEGLDRTRIASKWRRKSIRNRGISRAIEAPTIGIPPGMGGGIKGVIPCRAPGVV